MIPEMASTQLNMLTTTPAILGLILLTIAFADSPAEFAATKLDVTVESTRIITPVAPRPAMRIDCAMLVVPIPTICIPKMYIQRLAIVYATAEIIVPFTGFSTSLV